MALVLDRCAFGRTACCRVAFICSTIGVCRPWLAAQSVQAVVGRVTRLSNLWEAFFGAEGGLFGTETLGGHSCISHHLGSASAGLISCWFCPFFPRCGAALRIQPYIFAGLQAGAQHRLSVVVACAAACVMRCSNKGGMHLSGHTRLSSHDGKPRRVHIES
eukprot:1147999-Pelagomonas_calceolata.AAC.2